MPAPARNRANHNMVRGLGCLFTQPHTARIKIDDAQLKKLEGQMKLIPGMPVEAFIESRPRTFTCYLMQPLTVQLLRAFRNS